MKFPAFPMTVASSIAGILITAPAFAQDRMYPYIAPSNCDVSMTLPEDSNSAEFSKFCHYALIPPKTKSAMRVSNFAPSANIMQCRGVMSHLDSINKLEEALNVEANKIASLAAKSTDDGSLVKEQAKQAAISTALAGLRSAYSGIEAARAQIDFDGTQTEAQMNEIRNLNHQLTELKGIIFVRAPISEGYISFIETNVSGDQSRLDPAVLASSIPGFRSPGQTTGPVVMSGAMSGGITLSLAGACGLIEDFNYKVPLQAKVDQKKVAGLMVANYTYAVPVESGVEYSAKVNVDNAIKAISNEYKTSGHFSISDLMRMNLSGTSDEICQIKVTRYELTQTDPMKVQAFEDQLNGKICAGLIKRVVDRMVTKGFIDGMTKAAGASAPDQAGGNTAETAYRRECYDNSFAGISYDSGCSDVPYTVLTWHDGMSEKDLQINDQTHFEESESVSIGSVIQRWRTMIFTAQ